MTTFTKELRAFLGHVDRLAEIIDAPELLLPTYGVSEDFARPHIEFAGGQYHYVVVERGKEIDRKSSTDIDEILFHVFEGVTFSMAVDFERRRRRRNEDFRRQLFDAQLELLAKLNPDWRRRTRERLDEVLTRHPFVDDDGK